MHRFLSSSKYCIIIIDKEDGEGIHRWTLWNGPESEHIFCAMNSHLKKSTKDKTYLNSRMIRMTHNKNDICLFWQPCCSVAKSCSILWPDELLHTKLLCPSLSPGVCSNSHPLSWWCHSTSHPMSPPSPLSLSFSQYQGLFQWVSSSHKAAKVLGLQI